MTPEDYGRHLEGGLCWACHCSTHASHARQRQCSRCRRKWSYERLRLQWRLADLFCQGANAHQASRELGISYGTARGHFKKFADVFERSRQPAAQILISIRKEKNRVPERWRKVGLKVIYAMIVDTSFAVRTAPATSEDYLLLS